MPAFSRCLGTGKAFSQECHHGRDGPGCRGRAVLCGSLEAGCRGAAVKTAPLDLDVAATREGDRVCIHVLNSNFLRPVRASLAVEGRRVTEKTVYEIAPEDIRAYVDQTRPDAFLPVEKKLEGDTWTFPPRSVSVLALELDEDLP
jgi:hypothetical protein